MLVKPNTAFTGVPSGRVIGGRAWKARKMKPDPSIRIRCRGLASISGGMVPEGSMSASVISPCIQDVEARAVRTHHLLARDAQVNPRMTQRPSAAVAGDGAGIDMDDLGGFYRIGGRGGGAVRHVCPFCGLASRMMIAMWGMLSTVLRRLTYVLLAALLLSGCIGAGMAPIAHTGIPAETADSFVMPDGTALPYRVWLPVGRPAAVVLALHGMNDSRDAWEYPAPAFAAGGIAVYAPDLRGFGATLTRGQWPGTDGLTGDARMMTRTLRARYPHTKLILMAESMGAAALMVLATEPNPPDVDGYVLIAPAVWGRSEMNVLMRVSLWLAENTLPALTLTGRGIVKVTASDNREA